MDASSKLDGTVTEGRIGEATESSVLIDENSLSYADIKKAIVQVDFKAAE